eukprot:7192632-Pyramimonas_sp.AAC.1
MRSCSRRSQADRHISEEKHKFHLTNVLLPGASIADSTRTAARSPPYMRKLCVSAEYARTARLNMNTWNMQRATKGDKPCIRLRYFQLSVAE